VPRARAIVAVFKVGRALAIALPAGVEEQVAQRSLQHPQLGDVPGVGARRSAERHDGVAVIGLHAADACPEGGARSHLPGRAKRAAFLDPITRHEVRPWGHVPNESGVDGEFSGQAPVERKRAGIAGEVARGEMWIAGAAQPALECRLASTIART